MCDPGSRVASRVQCGQEFAQHESKPHLVAVCTMRPGHIAAHSNVLPKSDQWPMLPDGRCIGCGYFVDMPNHVYGCELGSRRVAGEDTRP